LVIFHAFAQKPPWADVHQIWFGGSCRWQIVGDRRREVKFVGSNISGSHRQSLSPL